MKVRIYTIDVKVPRWFRAVATPALVLIALGGVGVALGLPVTFVGGNQLKALELNQNFGDLDARLNALEADGGRLATLENTDYCPRLVAKDGTRRLYAKDLSTLGVVRCNWGTDEMVKVGDFWIDRYEMSAAGSLNLGGGPGQDTTANAASVAGVAPQTSITWFQAAEMCANAGKHLCTNAQWQTAAAGTPDPGSWPDTNSADGCSGVGSLTSCNTCSAGPGNVGQATSCESRFGARDMIGNVREWVADWHQAGGSSSTFFDDQPATPWPAAGYGADGTWNVNGRAHNGTAWMAGLPAVAVRGGDWGNGAAAGVFSLYWDHGPSNSATVLGARCCAGVR